MNRTNLLEIIKFLDPPNFRTIPCDLCGSGENEVLATTSRFGLPLTTVICRSCGFIYINPSMPEETYRKFYGRVYRELHPVVGGNEFHFERQYKEGLEILNFCRPFLPANGKVLEIGCGLGGISYAFLKAGYSVYAVEPSEGESAFARSKGIIVQNASFENADLKDMTFDLVILSRTMNHFLYPSREVQRIGERVSASGYFYCKVLDFPTQCLYDDISGCAQVDHLFMFSAETLRSILAKSGFETVKFEGYDGKQFPPVRSVPHFHMEAIAKKNPASARSPFIPNQYAIVLERLRRNQRYWKKRRLFYRVTYIHWAGMLIKALLGKRLHERLKRWNSN